MLKQRNVITNGLIYDNSFNKIKEKAIYTCICHFFPLSKCYGKNAGTSPHDFLPALIEQEKLKRKQKLKVERNV